MGIIIRDSRVYNSLTYCYFRETGKPEVRDSTGQEEAGGGLFLGDSLPRSWVRVTGSVKALHLNGLSSSA